MDINIHEKIKNMSANEKDRLLLEMGAKLSDAQLESLIAKYSAIQVRFGDMTVDEVCDFFKNQAQNVSKEALATLMETEGYKLSATPTATYLVYCKPEFALSLLSEHIKAMSRERRERLRLVIMNDADELYCKNSIVKNLQCCF